MQTSMPISQSAQNLQTLGGSIYSENEKHLEQSFATSNNSEENSFYEQNESSISSYCSKGSSVEACDNETVGGQAIIEGIMMRCKNSYALAVRLPNGSIQVESKNWYRFAKNSYSEKPFFRGFPILVETLINGIKTLNRSAELNSSEDESPITSTQLLFTLALAILMAIGLFVLVPHLLSALMQYLALSGDIESFSFQVWDGLYKFLVFFLYIAGISFIPEIRRVFQFHGAEHKVIAAYEELCSGKSGQDFIDVNFAAKQSRLHARCGTTFLLFVLALAIVIHSITLPLLFWLFPIESTFVKHGITLVIKILLMIPVSAFAYELIKYSSKLNSFWGNILKAPGLFLQIFTTREPQKEHLEVALVALKVALGKENTYTIITPEYNELGSNKSE